MEQEWNAKVDIQGNEVHFQLPKPTAQRLGLNITQESTRIGKFGDRPVVIEFLDETAINGKQYNK